MKILLALTLAAAVAGPASALARIPDEECDRGRVVFGRLASPESVRSQEVKAVAASEFVPAPRAGDGLEAAKAELGRLVDTLEDMIESGDYRGRQKRKLQGALASAKSALAGVEREISGGSSSSPRRTPLDEAIAQARVLHKLLGSYLAGKEEMGGYHLRQEPYEFEIAVDADTDRVLAKFPFLRGAARGRVRIGGQEVVTQFNSLKAEFYGTLLEAAHHDKKDSRLQGLAQWGRDTEVIYPGGDWMDHQAIIATPEYWALHLN